MHKQIIININAPEAKKKESRGKIVSFLILEHRKKKKVDHSVHTTYGWRHVS